MPSSHFSHPLVASHNPILSEQATLVTTFAKQLLKMGIKGERCLMNNLNMNRKKAGELHENRMMEKGRTNRILPPKPATRGEGGID